jgi:hypothetical protein
VEAGEAYSLGRDLVPVGQKVGQPVDCFHPEVVPTGVIDLGVHQLSAGQHIFAIEAVGANDSAVKSYMSGLDCVKIEPAE